MKRLSFVILAILFAIFGTKIAMAQDSTADIMQIEQGKYYLFVSTTCPHCANVERHIATNKLDETYDIEIIDIMVETDKQDDFLFLCQERVPEGQAQMYCGGVPTLIINNNIYIGGEDIINHFKSLGHDEEPADWGKWVVIGLLGSAGLLVVGLIVYPLVKKK